jgi:Family of unknown function (DUF6272)
VIVELSQHIRNDLEVSPKIREKVFCIFIELAQNVRSYSEKRINLFRDGKPVGIGTLVVSKNQKFISISTGNPMGKNKVDDLKERIKLVNALTREELRELKTRFRDQAVNEGYVTGNIGFIDIVMRAGSRLQTDWKDISETESYFSVSLEIPIV